MLEAIVNLYKNSYVLTKNWTKIKIGTPCSQWAMFTRKILSKKFSQDALIKKFQNKLFLKLLREVFKVIII